MDEGSGMEGMIAIFTLLAFSESREVELGSLLVSD